MSYGGGKEGGRGEWRTTIESPCFEAKFKGRLIENGETTRKRPKEVREKHRDST